MPQARFNTNISYLYRHIGQHEATDFQFVLFFLSVYSIIGQTKINTSKDDNSDFVLGYQQATGNFALW